MKLFAATAVFAALFATTAVANDPITPIDNVKRGTMVTVQGTIERITDDDEFRLADASGTIRVYIGPNWVPANVGETVTVDGWIDDDPGPLELYARSLTHADGTVIAFDRHYD